MTTVPLKPEISSSQIDPDDSQPGGKQSNKLSSGKVAGVLVAVAVTSIVGHVVHKRMKNEHEDSDEDAASFVI